MNKWIMRNIMYKPMRNQLDKKLIKMGGLRGEANDLYNIMWFFACSGLFTEEQKQDLRQAVPYRDQQIEFAGNQDASENAFCEREYYHVFYRDSKGEIREEEYNSLQEMDNQHEFEKSEGFCHFKVVKVLKVFIFAKEIKTKWNA